MTDFDGQAQAIDTEGDMEGGGGSDTQSTYVTFDLADQTLGVAVRHVREILDLQKVSRLPNAPGEIEGVIDIRGTSVPIYDLGARLGLHHGPLGEDSRIIVFEVAQGAQSQALGVLADRVRNVTQIAPEAIEPPPAMAGRGVAGGVLHGISRLEGDLVMLLDLTRVFRGTSVEDDALGPF